MHDVSKSADLSKEVSNLASRPEALGSLLPNISKMNMGSRCAYCDLVLAALSYGAGEVKTVTFRQSNK